jgi:hypothetical protein
VESHSELMEPRLGLMRTAACRSLSLESMICGDALDPCPEFVGNEE